MVCEKCRANGALCLRHRQELAHEQWIQEEKDDIAWLHAVARMEREAGI